MTEKNKQRIAAGSGVLLIALAGVVTAYFGADDTEPNLVKVGEDRIEVTEVFTQPTQSEDYKFRKLVKIENTGSVPCYVRAALEFSDSAVQNASWLSAENQGDSDPPPEDSAFRTAAVPVSKEDKSFYFNDLPKGWVYVWEGSSNDYDPSVTNGYFYYTSPLDPGEATEALLSWVKVKYANEEAIQAYDIYVYSESVQTVDPNSGTAYTDWKAAWNSFAR